MLFQLVTGRIPFDADSPLAIAYAHVQEEPPLASSVNRSLPPAVDALITRALKKNPNERFPSAEAMRGECLRVSQSFQAVPPSIVPGTHGQSGSGVGSAVFPPVDQSAPAAPGSIQTPYTPGPSQQHTPNPYGTPLAPGPASAYGYPQQGAPQGGYATPHPPYGTHPGGPSTPPYNLSPQSGPGGGRNNKPVVIGSIAVSVMAVGGLIAALTLNGAGRKTIPRGTAPRRRRRIRRSTAPATSREIEKTECTEPRESNNDPEEIQLPNFKFKHIKSVKECFQAAGWRYEVINVDENTYGDGTIMKQYPAADTDVEEDDVPEIQLYVSTGKPA